MSPLMEPGLNGGSPSAICMLYTRVRKKAALLFSYITHRKINEVEGKFQCSRANFDSTHLRIIVCLLNILY